MRYINLRLGYLLTYSRDINLTENNSSATVTIPGYLHTRMQLGD